MMDKDKVKVLAKLQNMSEGVIELEDFYDNFLALVDFIKKEDNIVDISAELFKFIKEYNDFKKKRDKRYKENKK